MYIFKEITNFEISYLCYNNTNKDIFVHLKNKE